MSSPKKYSSDSPVSIKEQDQFSRWKFAKRIAEIIAKRSDPDSIVIGLNGVWGDGKTSVLNFVEQSLLSNEGVICIKFNPWIYGNEESLLTSFFVDIAEALDENLINKTDNLKEIAKKVAPGVTSLLGAKGLGESVGSFISGPNISELKDRIEALLKAAKKRVLILIDDVDRLEKSEIHSLFRLVKLTADFKYTSYILAFDKDIVAASLQDRYSSSTKGAGYEFLEKIIQVPLHLPIIDKKALLNFCYQGVEEALSIAQINLSKQQIQEFLRGFQEAFELSLTTPRKAKLYGNILTFSLPILRGEVNPIDLMFLEGIRIFHPKLYEAIRVNKSIFIGHFGRSLQSDNEKEKEHIRNVIDSTFSSEEKINKLGYINLLKIMFPKLEAVYGNMSYGADWHKHWDKAQRVCSANYISRYFTYSVPSDDISDNIIDNLLLATSDWVPPFSAERNPLNNVVNEQNSEMLISKLRKRATDIEANASMKLALSISLSSDTFPNPEMLFSHLNAFSQAAMLISSLIQNLDKNERVEAARLCIKSAPSLDFKLEIFRWLKREEEDKPEKDAFSQSETDDIGKKLAEDMYQVITNVDDVTKLYPKSIPYIFRTLETFLNKGSVDKYVNELLLRNPDSSIRIIDSYRPTAWNNETGISHKSDFEKEQYEQLNKVLDPSILSKSITQNHLGYIEQFDELPMSYHFDEEREYLGIEQFIYLHNQVTTNKDHQT